MTSVNLRYTGLLLIIIITIKINLIFGNTTITEETNCIETTTTVTFNKTAAKQLDNGNKTFDENGFLSVVTQQTVQLTTTAPITTPTLVSSTDEIERINLCKCGIAPSFATGKIVGGTPVNELNFWPWFAALVRTDRPTRVHCGSSLISRRYVLTAAHCLIPMIQVGLRNFSVKLGYNELWEKHENQTVSTYDRFDVPIESVTLHPKYEQSFPYHYDIGVVKLSYPINCTNRVRPICLPHTDHHEKLYANKIAITTGFGRTSTSGNHSRVLQQIPLKLVPINDCVYNFSKLPFKAPELLDSMICAWNKGKDSCVGDSGGPLFLWRKWYNDATATGKSETSNFEQVGVTSWGIGCANEKFPGIYTKVGTFLPWIKSIVDSDTG